MLLSLKKLSGYSVFAKEAKVGKADQFYFDDEKWTIRYFIVDTGPWFSRSKLLVSPLAIQNIDSPCRTIFTNLTKDQLLKSPDIDTDMPISRQTEKEYLNYYKWPYYWTGAGTWGTGTVAEAGFSLPSSFENPEVDLSKIPRNEEENDHHLRSTKEVFGYRVDATDAEFGRLDDFIIDKRTWTVRYLVIELRNWIQSKTVLISREWAETFSLRQKKIRVSISRDKIEGSPEFNPDAPLNRDYEVKLHEYYAREKYWERKRSKSAA